MSEYVHVLHISDLHFGAEANETVSPTAVAKRKNTLDAFFNKLTDLDQDWWPDVVVISGDIGWKGKASDYKEAKAWIDVLLDKLGLSAKDLIICPGNHDLDRKWTLGTKYPSNYKEADEWLEIENIEVFGPRFSDYTDFYSDLGMPKMLLKTQENCLMGVREVKGLRFIVLNSAWFAKGNSDSQNLWIGQPQLEVLKSKGQLVNKKELDNIPITIAVLHHPKAWLHDSERHSHTGRQSSYEMLATGCHVILSGHVHSETIEEPDKISNCAYLFTGGATYTGNSYRNNFSIYRINVNERTIMRRGYEFNPAKQEWKWDSDSAIPYSLRQFDVTTKSKVAGTVKKKCEYYYIVKRVGQSAEKYIEYKSKAVASKTQVSMPKIISRVVAVHNSPERVKLKKNIVELDSDGNYAPIENVVMSGRPAFLFGEVGSGKSTIAGTYVKHISEKIEGQIPLLIPAGFFLNRNEELKTLSSYCSLISNFVNEDILLSDGKFDLLEAFSGGYAVTIVIDGFDELDRDTAQILLRQTENLIDRWPNLRILVTGRPIELRGLDYSKWQCMSMLPLTTDDQRQILYNEAIADGFNETDADVDADKRLSYLNVNSDLASVVTTPLVLRLLRPYLTQNQQSLTLGDLLYNVMNEKLGEWNSKDGKELNLPEFKAVFPTPYSREGLLGKISAEIYNSPNRAITQENLYALISNEIGNINKKHSVIDQTCIFFKNNILDENNNLLTFPSQPLLECGLGCYIVDMLINKQKPSIYIEDSRLWRAYSFAAAIARRKNLINELRFEFEEFISNISKDKSTLVTAEIAFIVSEAGDLALASHFISYLKVAGFRPLMFFRDIKASCMNAYAKCIFLAGNDGFEWFYSQYLDIKYPITYLDLDFVTDILRNYVLISNYQIENKYKDLLVKFIQPIIASKSALTDYVLPVLALLMPNCFDTRDRIRLYVINLNFPLAKEKVIQTLKAEYESGDKKLVLESLELISKADGISSVVAAELWLELSPNEPPLVIIHKAVLDAGMRNNLNLLQEIERRIGFQKIENMLRLHALEMSNLGSASSLILYKRGERDLYRIGNGLLYSLHDARRIAESEVFIHELIKANGVNGFHWFLETLPSFSRYDGIDSAHWRILLEEFRNSEYANPRFLRYATNYLGEFNLTRYPEIRRGFQLLFQDKPEYKAILQDALFSYERKLRYNAACILFVCYPDTEIIAADIIIQNSGNASAISYEWLRFCFKLLLGESVVRYISSNLDKYLNTQKTFALALLHHNKKALSEDNYNTLVLGMLANRSFDYVAVSEKENILDPILAEDRAFEKLVSSIDNQNLTIQRNACGALWDYHRTKLTIEQYAKCLTVITDDFFNLGFRSMYKEFDQHKDNSNFVSTVLKVSKSVQALTGHEPLGGLYLRTLENEDNWKDLLWKGLFGKDTVSYRHIGEAILWFLKTGTENHTIGKILGAAAKEYMQHPSILADQQRDNVLPWLALLVDEFNTISKGDFEKILLENSRDTETINAALISRLGYIPQNYRVAQGDKRLLFVDGGSSNIQPLSFEDVVELTRDAAEFPPNYLSAVEAALLTDSLLHSEIVGIANKSNSGVIFALILSFCRKQPLEYQWIPRSLELFNFGYDSSGIKDSLRHIVDAIKGSIANDHSCKDDYVSYINSVIKHQPDQARLLWKLLFEADRQSITIQLLPLLINDLSQRLYKLDYELAALIVDYVFSLEAEVEKETALREFNRLAFLIDARTDKYQSVIDGYTCWLVSLIAIFLSGEVTNTSERLLLYGLQSFYIHHYERGYNRTGDSDFFPARNIINVTYQLLEKINPSLIGECWERGLKSDCPEIQSCCKVLTAIPH